jgi:hypothetical protein
MERRKILLIIFSIIFLLILLYFIFTITNRLKGFRLIKDYIQPVNTKKVDYEMLKNKYKINDCNKMCKNQFCDEYHTQMIKYDLCKECKKENMCYDNNKGICVKCKDNYTCEQLYGCNNKPPLNPIDNYCTKCWQ